MMKSKHIVSWNKINGFSRYLLVHLLSGVMPYYIVNEYPKSGGSWLSQMLAAAINVPFPRNRLPILKRSILQGHYLHSWNMKNVIVVWRDCRDVIVSQYFYSLFYNDRGNQNLVKQTRKRLRFTDYDNITDNLPEFIRYIFEVKRHPRFTWADFVDQWADNKDVINVKYEELLKDTSDQLMNLVRAITGYSLPEEKAKKIAFDYSFAQMSGRLPGQEDRTSFMRKGVSGDWKNWFCKKARVLLNQYAGKELIKLGYEPNANWVYHD